MYTLCEVWNLRKKEREQSKKNKSVRQNIEFPPSNKEWVSKLNNMGRTSMRLESSGTEFSAFLMPEHFNTVPLVVVTPNIKVFFVAPS